MPVHAERIDGKWRVVEAGGHIALNASKTPLDGGGFSNRDQAASQATAVNISLHKEGKI